MASNSPAIRTGIQVVLAIVIVVLAVILYQSITGPYEIIRERERATERTRMRMDHVRQAMIRYNEVHGRFVTDLDSLVMFVRTDSVLVARRDTLFGPGFEPDSLPYSPRTGNRFELAVNDTSRVNTYRLDDPDSDDYIGTILPDVTRLNAASWR
jgi:hypothetical protein